MRWKSRWQQLRWWRVERESLWNFWPEEENKIYWNKQTIVGTVWQWKSVRKISSVSQNEIIESLDLSVVERSGLLCSMWLILYAFHTHLYIIFNRQIRMPFTGSHSYQWRQLSMSLYYKFDVFANQKFHYYSLFHFVISLVAILIFSKYIKGRNVQLWL